VSGKVILHAAVSDERVQTWAEVTIEERGDRMAERVAYEFMKRERTTTS
jgi:hypothetical protein